MAAGSISSQTRWPTSKIAFGAGRDAQRLGLAQRLHLVVPVLAEIGAVDDLGLDARWRPAWRPTGRSPAAGVEKVAAVALDEVGAADEARDEAAPRPAVEDVRRIDLLDAALVHHHDAVGRHHRLGLVVRDVDGGDLELVVQAADLEAHLLAQVGVEVGQRLVEQQHLRLDHDGARQRHALLLAARQLGRIAALEARPSARRRGSRSTRRSISARGSLRTSRPKPTFSPTVMFGQMA